MKFLKRLFSTDGRLQRRIQRLEHKLRVANRGFAVAQSRAERLKTDHPDLWKQYFSKTAPK